MKSVVEEKPEEAVSPSEAPSQQHVTKAFHFPFSGSKIKLAGLIILVVAIIATVVVAGYATINNSHASGTVTLSVDNTVSLDLAHKKVTFFLHLTSSGDNPPQVAAVKVRVVPTFSNQLPSVTPGEVKAGNFNVPFGLLSFVPHMPLAFPLASNNPRGIPPFNGGPMPSISPLPTCPPLPILQSNGGGTADVHPVPPCYYHPTPSGGPVPSAKPTPSISPLPTCPPFRLGIAQKAPSAPCIYTPGAPNGKGPVPAINGETGVTGTPGTIEKINSKLDEGDSNAIIVRPMENGILYFSVGDQYTKTVNGSVVLADLTITLPLPIGFDPTKPIDATTIALFKNVILKIAFGQDTKVYGLSGDPKSPFVAIPFIAQDATFNLMDLLNGTVPTVTVSPTPTPNPLTPTIVPLSPGPKKVSINTILDCLDLHKPIADLSSNYYSANCIAHTDRANADLNGDGWINQIDLNIYYRQALGVSH